MSDKPDEPFLRRWSRLKRASGATAARRSGGGAAPVALARATPASEPAPSAAKVPPDEEQRPRAPEEEALIKDLPPIESLTKESDFTAFFKKGVPDDLRQKALKRLWSLDPQFDVVDVFTEYGGDYTKMDPIDPVTQTIYKVGLGFLNDRELAVQKGELPAEAEEVADADKDKDKGEKKEVTATETDTAVTGEPATSAAVGADAPTPAESATPAPFSPPSAEPEPVPTPPTRRRT